VLAIGLGVFAPRLEHALSGAMWEVDGSESLAAPELIDEQFGGLSSQSAVVVVHSDPLAIDDPAFQQVIADVGEIIEAEEGYRPTDTTDAGHERQDRDDPGRRPSPRTTTSTRHSATRRRSSSAWCSCSGSCC
jgi:hypothetical protein